MYGGFIKRHSFLEPVFNLINSSLEISKISKLKIAMVVPDPKTINVNKATLGVITLCYGDRVDRNYLSINKK